MAESLQDIGRQYKNPLATVLGTTLVTAVEGVMNNGKSPGRKQKELDNRGSHFYLALYWAQALVAQTENKYLAERFKLAAAQLAEKEATILQEFANAEGTPVPIGGYYRPDPYLVAQA